MPSGVAADSGTTCGPTACLDWAMYCRAANIPPLVDEDGKGGYGSQAVSTVSELWLVANCSEPGSRQNEYGSQPKHVLCHWPNSSSLQLHRSGHPDEEDEEEDEEEEVDDEEDDDAEDELLMADSPGEDQWQQRGIVPVSCA
jgi:hypothetical protein